MYDILNTVEIDFSCLSPNDFENLVYDLLSKSRFYNLNWRDGGADGGRDITAESRNHDASDYIEARNWFVDAKIYRSGIPFNKIQPSLARATSHRLDYLLFVVLPHLTPPCKDNLEQWINENKPQYKVRIWEKKDIVKRLIKNPEILRKYLPDSWSNEIEVSTYFKEAEKVLEAFRNRIKPVWRTPEKRPMTDLIRFTPKKPNDTIVGSDNRHKLESAELVYLKALLASAVHMDELLSKTFGLPNNEYIRIVKWKEHPEDYLCLPLNITDVLTEKKISCINHILAHLFKSYEEFIDKGISAMAGSLPPHGTDDRASLYAIKGSINI